MPRTKEEMEFMIVLKKHDLNYSARLWANVSIILFISNVLDKILEQYNICIKNINKLFELEKKNHLKYENLHEVTNDLIYLLVSDLIYHNTKLLRKSEYEKAIFYNLNRIKILKNTAFYISDILQDELDHLKIA